jgi:glutamate-1-semialdehyde 2,1-aminomutase
MRGSGEYFGFVPDMMCYCKAIANGYSLSAIVGKDEFKAAASKVFFTGTYYTAASELAAALATIDELESTNAIDRMTKMGEMLKEGLRKRADAYGLQIQMTGPATLPFMTFANERNFRRSQCFSAESAKRGVLLHPHHNWFMMYCHEEADVQQALDIADEAFGVVKKQFGN